MIFRNIAVFIRTKTQAQDIKTTKMTAADMDPRLAPFTAPKPVGVGIDTYLYHLVKNVTTSPAIMLMTLVYLERATTNLSQDGGMAPLTSLNAHRYPTFLTLQTLPHRFCPRS